MGEKHGNHDVTYVEYMCAAIEKQLVVGGKESYLNHIKLRKYLMKKWSTWKHQFHAPPGHTLTTLTAHIWLCIQLMENVRGRANWMQNLLRVQFWCST